MATKVCSRCKEEKDIECFSRDKRRLDGLDSRCKECRRNGHQQYYQDNKMYCKEQTMLWRCNNKEQHVNNNIQWKNNNKDRHTAYQRQYKTNKYHNDVAYKLTRVLRSRLNKALAGNYKSGSAINDLGCSIEELKSYFESKFQDGMSWANYGEWHIDHIIPLASFNLEEREELLKACHYTNLQPLWAKDNLSKGDRIG